MLWSRSSFASSVTVGTCKAIEERGEKHETTGKASQQKGERAATAHTSARERERERARAAGADDGTRPTYHCLYLHALCRADLCTWVRAGRPSCSANTGAFCSLTCHGIQSLVGALFRAWIKPYTRTFLGSSGGAGALHNVLG